MLEYSAEHQSHFTRLFANIVHFTQFYFY